METELPGFTEFCPLIVVKSVIYFLLSSVTDECVEMEKKS